MLHTGRHYPDDLSDDGLIYHYPVTNRPPSRDKAEVEATKEAGRLAIPIFVILPAKGSTTRRVRLGWVEDWDDATKQFLILFGEQPPPYQPASPDRPFSLTDDAQRKTGTHKLRPGQQAFRFQVLAQYGCRCAACTITEPALIVAAHIRDKAHRGSDDWRNGLPLCQTHHAAFDAGMFSIDPETLAISMFEGQFPASIGVTNGSIKVLKDRPHPDALAWRYSRQIEKRRASADAPS